MKHNKKTILLILITITTLILLSTASATTDTNTTTTSSIKEKTTTTEPVVKEKIENTKPQTKDKTQDKTITKTNKTQKNTKTSTKTVEVNNYDELISTLNSINDDSEHDEYIINLNEGDYKAKKKNTVTSTGKSIVINGNNQTITGTARYFTVLNMSIELNNLNLNFVRFNASSKISNSTLISNILIYNDLLIDNTNINSISNINTTITIKNSIITSFLGSGESLTTFHNTTLNGTIKNEGGTIIINDDCTLGEKYEYPETNTGTLISNLTENYDGTMEITNKNITTSTTIPVTGNITFTNCQINAKITNNGNLTLQNCTLSNNNLTTSGSKTNGFLLENNGQVTMTGCMVENNTFNTTQTFSYNSNAHLYGAIVNKGVLNIVDSVFNNNRLGYVNVSPSGWYITGKYVGSGSCIVNKENGQININSSTFSNNFAGYLGGAIASFGNGNININNSVFRNNSATLTGEAIYIGPTINEGYIPIRVSILRTNFTENYIYTHVDDFSTEELRGTISLDMKYNLPSIATAYFYDCIIENNLSSEFNTTLEKTTFNQSTITIQEPSIANNGGMNNQMSNNTFHSTNITTIYTQIYNNTLTNSSLSTSNSSIHNNKFINNSRLGTNDDNNIYNNTYIHVAIDDTLELNIPEKIFTGEAITIIGTYTINKPENYDENILEQNKFEIFINDELVKTIDTLNFTIIPTTTDTRHITVQPTISQTRKAFSIRPYNNVTITPENYDEYIYAGTLLGVNRDSKVTFQGTFTDKGEIYIDTPDIIIDGIEAKFTNTIFKLEATGIALQNMNINNTQTEYPIQNTKDNNIITNNTITITNTVGKTAAIYNKASNTEISQNTIYVDGPAGDIDYEGNGVCTTQAILLIGGNQNTVENNDITITSTSSASSFGTIEGITNSKQATNTIIKGNKLNVSGGMFNYAINSLTNIANITITENNILVTGERYTDGIQVGDNAENINITKNNITCYCLNTTPIDQAGITYGIITTKQGGQQSNNINIAENNIQLTGRANYGIEIYETNNTQVTDNNITLTGIKSMGIGYAHSPNSTITGNTIITNDNSITPLTGIVEEIQPQNVGIQIQQDSNSIFIIRNTIQTYDKGTQDTCINIDSNNITVYANYLTSTTKTGNEAVLGQEDTDITFNYPIFQESRTNIKDEIIIGKNTTLTAQFYDDTYTPISDGKAIFKVNGKTLRDNQGNVIYVDVINGRAELPNINITQEWAKPDTTIQAIYIGEDNNDPITTKPTTINVTKPEATITLETPTTANAGTTITLKATVTDGDNAISSGRVAFKLNGKTLKDPKTGKALYANIENGIATITYTIPEKTKAKTYNLTAVFTDIAYDRKEASAELVVAKA